MSTQELENRLNSKTIRLTDEGRGIAELIAEIDSTADQTQTGQDHIESELMVQFYQLLKNSADNVFGLR